MPRNNKKKKKDKKKYEEVDTIPLFGQGQGSGFPTLGGEEQPKPKAKAKTKPKKEQVNPFEGMLDSRPQQVVQTIHHPILDNKPVKKEKKPEKKKEDPFLDILAPPDKKMKANPVSFPTLAESNQAADFPSMSAPQMDAPMESSSEQPSNMFQENMVPYDNSGNPVFMPHLPSSLIFPDCPESVPPNLSSRFGRQTYNKPSIRIKTRPIAQSLDKCKELTDIINDQMLMKQSSLEYFRYTLSQEEIELFDQLKVRIAKAKQNTFTGDSETQADFEKFLQDTADKDEEQEVDICNYYMQGNCKYGDACQSYHPPNMGIQGIDAEILN